MTTQAKNIIEREGVDAIREKMKGGAEFVEDTVENFVDSLHGAVVAPVQEVMDYTPVIKGMVIGYLAGAITVLLSLLALQRQ